MKKYYFLTTTLNFIQIIAYGKILPSSFFSEKSIFGKIWHSQFSIPTNEILLFDKYPLSKIKKELDTEDYPLVIELFENHLDSSILKEILLDNNEKIYLTNMPINIEQQNITIYFDDSTRKDRWLSKYEEVSEYKKNQNVSFDIQPNILENTLNIDDDLNLKISNSIQDFSRDTQFDTKTEIINSRKKAADYGYYIGNKIDNIIHSMNNNDEKIIEKKADNLLLIRECVKYLSNELPNDFQFENSENKKELLTSIWKNCFSTKTFKDNCEQLKSQNINLDFVSEDKFRLLSIDCYNHTKDLINQLRKHLGNPTDNFDSLNAENNFIQSLAIILDTNCDTSKIYNLIQTKKIKSVSSILALYGVFTGYTRFSKIFRELYEELSREKEEKQSIKYKNEAEENARKKIIKETQNELDLIKKKLDILFNEVTKMSDKINFSQQKESSNTSVISKKCEINTIKQKKKSTKKTTSQFPSINTNEQNLFNQTELLIEDTNLFSNIINFIRPKIQNSEDLNKIHEYVKSKIEYIQQSYATGKDKDAPKENSDTLNHILCLLKMKKDNPKELTNFFEKIEKELQKNLEDTYNCKREINYGTKIF